MADKRLPDDIIEIALNKCDEILSSKRIILKDVPSVEREALLSLLLIYLYSLILQLEKKGITFNWKDEDSEEKTISELIKYGRDALCHLESNKNFDGDFFRFNIYLGCQNAPKIEDKYSDDAAIFLGKRYILYWRHIVKLFIEIKKSVGKEINLKDYFPNL